MGVSSVVSRKSPTNAKRGFQGSHRPDEKRRADKVSAQRPCMSHLPDGTRRQRLDPVHRGVGLWTLFLQRLRRKSHRDGCTTNAVSSDSESKKRKGSQVPLLSIDRDGRTKTKSRRERSEVAPA